METVTDKDTLERLNRALHIAFAQRGITKKRDMAAYLEYESPAFSNIINGKINISDKFLRSISEKLGISIRYIKYGEGDAFNVQPTGQPADTNAQLATCVTVIASQQRTIEKLTDIINNLRP